jgi:membrane protease YdiL (CAAX protease family)
VVLAVLVMGLMVSGTGALWLLSFRVLGPERAESFANTFFIQCIVFTTIIGGGMHAGWLLGYARSPRLLLNLMPASWSVVALAALAGAALTFPLGEVDNLWQLVLPASEAEAQLMVSIHAPASAFERVFIILSLVAAAATGEELLFRGMLWRWLEDSWGKVAALVVTSLVFGLAHVYLWRTIPLIVPVGFLLGWLVLRSGSVASSMAAHAAFNGTPIVASWSGLQVVGWNDVTARDPHLHPALVVAGTAVLLACLAAIHVLTRDRIDEPPSVH